jgi:squalene-hopene/tetraprenyl-beta-curcumene cyclase
MAPPSLANADLLGPDLAAAVQSAVVRTRDWLLGQQQTDGHWCAELEGDTILESEYVLLLAYLGRESAEVARHAADYLLEKQLPQGGWAMYPGGRLEISGSVKAYFALKLAGHDPQADDMQRARQAILAHGGADAVNSFTRYCLALLGQIPYDLCPAIPPQVVLLPRWSPVTLAAVSAWSRTILVPLSIISTFQPVRRLEPERGIRELFCQEPEHWPSIRPPETAGYERLFGWDRFFRSTDAVFRWCQKRGLLPFQDRAVEAARRWMLARFEGSDGLGAIFPSITWSLIALRCLGYAEDSPEVQACHRELERLVLRNPTTGSIRLQPCQSPVWDTAVSLRALAAAGLTPDSPAVHRGVQWLVDRQILCRGDWSDTVDAEPGGWCFEYRNDFYPDVDDTAMVLMALGRREGGPAPGDQRITAAVQRGVQWMLAMQNRDGGWGAFDRDNDRQFLCHVPFADHNAMIDPSAPDLAGRVLECLGQLGYRLGHPAVDRAVAYLRRAQEADGAWYGRWGVNYIYGTWQSLTGLTAVGVAKGDPAVCKGIEWMLKYQQPSGGWGESADSYADPSLRGQGPPTASQTAWAVLGLLAGGLEQHPAVRRGIGFLLKTQNVDGTWPESEFTGTGFPLVFYLRYHYYPLYFPLLALARWQGSA